MNYTKAVFLINPSVRAIAVNYDPNETKATLFKTFDNTLVMGDYVVVPTDTRHKMTVAKVVGLDVDVDIESPLEMDWVIAKVDRADFERIEKDEAQAVAAIRSAEMRRKREQLRDSLLVDQVATIGAMPIAQIGGEPAPLTPPPAPTV